MSQNLNLELSDSIFEVIQQQADAAGTSPATLVREVIEKQFHTNLLSDEEIQKAKARFESHFGEVDFGYPLGADNESIDEDLAKAYADTHKTG